MRIPDTLNGTTFDLYERDTFCQLLSGNQTIVSAINGDWWGPTMIWNKGDVVHINVHNQLTDTTTVHWHGMHLPAIMDGGPHQVIPPHTTWSPYWQVSNNAGTYWYHPHLHMEAEKQLNEGLGGLIIIRDSAERSLNLPRTYGVDDIPLVLTDRKFDASNQIVSASFGDSMMANGTVRAQYTIPAQVVRFRILDAATERSYNLGFSDNRNFYVITTDGGLLDTAVMVNRFLISPGERVEILLNCTGQSGTSMDLKGYNASLTQQVAGGENFTTGPFANALGHKDFNIVHLNVGAATGSPITTIPAVLAHNTFYNAADAAITRNVAITDSAGVGPGPVFVLNHHIFDLNTIDYSVPLNNTEIWQITSTSTFSHPFHIHDVEFYLLSINGATPPAYQQGWKDVILVRENTTVKFITRFTDYSDSSHPYMFHCHIALHEDQGMMGQFVVGSSPSGLKNVLQNSKMKLYPNPAKGKLTFEMEDDIRVVHADIINPEGKQLLRFDLDDRKKELEVSSLKNGLYFIRLLDSNGQHYIKAWLAE
jgi:blue copper oxidase